MNFNNLSVYHLEARHKTFKLFIDLDLCFKLTEKFQAIRDGEFSFFKLIIWNEL